MQLIDQDFQRRMDNSLKSKNTYFLVWCITWAPKFLPTTQFHPMPVLSSSIFKYLEINFYCLWSFRGSLKAVMAASMTFFSQRSSMSVAFMIGLSYACIPFKYYLSRLTTNQMVVSVHTIRSIVISLYLRRQQVPVQSVKTYNPDQILMQQQKNLQKTFFHQLRQAGESALDSLVSLQLKYPKKTRSVHDIKPILCSYKTILSNICLQLKRLDIQIITKPILRLFQEVTEITHSFISGKLLPPSDVLIENECWDVDGMLNQKIGVICDKALQNTDEVDQVSNKTQNALVEIMAALSRQLSSIDAVDVEDVHYTNFEGLVLKQLQHLHQRGISFQIQVENGKSKLRNLIGKMVETDQYRKKKLTNIDKGSVSTCNQDTQTIDFLLATPETLPVPIRRTLMNIQPQFKRVSCKQQKQQLLFQIEQLGMSILAKDLEVEILRKEIYVAKQSARQAQQKLVKQGLDKSKESALQLRRLTIQQKVINLSLLIIVSEKMISLEEVKPKLRATKSMSRKAMTDQNFFVQKRKDTPDFRRSTFVSKKSRLFETSTAMQTIEQSTPNLKTQPPLCPQQPKLIAEADILNSAEKQSQVKSKGCATRSVRSAIKLHGNQSVVRKQAYTQQSLSTAKISFLVRTEDSGEQKTTPLVVSNSLRKDQHGASSRFKNQPGHLRAQDVDLTPAELPLFTVDDLEIFGGKANALRFEMTKVKKSRYLDKQISFSGPKTGATFPLSKSNPREQTILQFYKFLRVANRSSSQKLSPIMSFLRFPHSYTESPQLQLRLKRDQTELGFCQLKSVLSRILDLHESCQKDTEQNGLCNHMRAFFEKVGFMAKCVPK